MALSPRGVAALSSPSMLAEAFMAMLPLAGCPCGMPGKILRKKGATPCANSWITPACSPIFMMPSHSVITPTKPSEMSKPVLAMSNRPLSICPNRAVCPMATFTAATAKPTRMKPIQMKFSAMCGSASEVRAV